MTLECMSLRFLRASIRETLLQKVRTSHLRVVSSAAGKIRTVETRQHADAAKRAHTVLSCVFRRIFAGLLTLERNDCDVRASAGYFSETCNYSKWKKTCLWTYAGKRKRCSLTWKIPKNTKKRVTIPHELRVSLFRKDLL